MLNKNPLKIKLKKYNLDDPESKKYLNKFLFSEISSKYNFAKTFLSFGMDYSWKKKLVKMIPLKESLKILDIACGTGDVSFLLAKKFKDAEITGIDLNDKMIALAEKNLKYNNIVFKERDMNNTGFIKDSFDAVTGGYALRNSPDIKKLIDELYRIMKTGSKAFFLDFSKPSIFLFRVLILFLLNIWGSVCGILLHGNPDIYSYISKSLKHFPDNKELFKLLKAAGFINIKFKFLFFGFLYILTFEK